MRVSSRCRDRIDNTGLIIAVVFLGTVALLIIIMIIIARVKQKRKKIRATQDTEKTAKLVRIFDCSLSLSALLDIRDCD
jgi:hypothetical protein